MSGIEEKDYVLRQLRGLAQVMARIAGLRVAGDFVAAREELARACAVWLGVDGALLERLDAGTVVGLLGNSEKVEGYLALLAEASLVAEAAGDVDQAERVRARELAIRSVGVG